MEKESLWGYFDNNFPSNIVIKLTKDTINKLEQLSLYYGKPKQEIISALVLHEWSLQEEYKQRTIIVKKSPSKENPEKRVMFRISQQVKNRYNRLTYNTSNIRKSDFISSWIEKEYRVIGKEK